MVGKRKREEAGSTTLSQTTGSPRALLSRLEHLSPSGSAEVQPSSVQLLQQLPRMSELDDVILHPRDSTAAAAAAAALGDDLAKHPFLPPRPDADRMVSSYLEFHASTYPIFHRPTLLQQIDDIYQSAETTKSTDVYNLYIILALSHEMERHGKGPGREADHAQGMLHSKQSLWLINRVLGSSAGVCPACSVWAEFAGEAAGASPDVAIHPSTARPRK